MQPEPHWTNYVAIMTGMIGACTGIAGSIMGYIAYRRSNEIKKSDRLLNLKKLRNGVHFAAKGLFERLPKALLSHKAALTARGLLLSRGMEVYEAEHTKDLNHAKELSNQIPPDDTNYVSMNQQQLEQELVRLDRIEIEINELLAKYQDSIQQDRRVRELISKQRL